MKIFKHLYDLPEHFCQNITKIAIDTEATGLNIFRDRLCVVQVMINDGDIHVINYPEQKYESPNLKKILSDDLIAKFFHFARFDMHMIFRYLKVLTKNIFCTRILSKITRTYSDKHGLKELCRELLKKEINKSEQASYWGRDELTQSQVSYAAGDVTYIYEIFNVLKEISIREKRYDFATNMFNIMPIIIEIDDLHFNPVNILSI